eukprot:CAMPEP_0203962556 /NCGR_PEP_ID=MMETSP0359-20131031/92711_1 /ASSEMBLY_ACC=CAM_ASM_000338 /TAXON_ID=268821 /ORGANISM="Scrippsiella Hangoei, Strain SHTV-5" /LENGTH=79 /DNA_ID=CAMNT_0050897915 /DNA_START=20 /DNA_END=256 /DNA_ORIENTATION=+
MYPMSHDLRSVDALKGNILCKPVQGNRPAPAPGTFAETPLRSVRPMPVMPRYREGSACSNLSDGQARQLCLTMLLWYLY